MYQLLQAEEPILAVDLEERFSAVDLEESVSVFGFL